MSQRRLLINIIFVLLVAFLLAACRQRPLPTNNDNEAATPTVEAVVNEENLVTSEEGEEVEETAVNPTESEPEASTGADEDADEPEDDPEEAAAESNAEQTTAVPTTHTVAEGETLYQIGLQYGISWDCTCSTQQYSQCQPNCGRTGDKNSSRRQSS